MNVSNHASFEKWEDPESGIPTYLLRHRVAAYQRSIYFMQWALRGENPLLWFQACHPPSREWYPCCVDVSDPCGAVVEMPEVVGSGNPLLLEDGLRAYVPLDDAIHLVDPYGEERCRQLFRLPKEVVQGRHLYSLVTDLSLSCDGREFLVDAEIGNRWLLATVNRDSGELTVLQWFGSRHYHAVFSLHDPTLFMVNHGHWVDRVTGDKFAMNNRIWVMDTKMTRYAPLLPDAWFGRNSETCHEWWTPSGKIAYCDYRTGVWETDVESRDSVKIWDRRCIHAMGERSGRYYVGDEGCYNWNDRIPCSVWFFNRKTGREVPIVSKMPPQPIPWRDFRTYHIDPHPAFSEDGQWVTYTTTAPGYLTVGLTPVESLVAATS